MDKDLVLVGAADSIGVPYTRDNCNQKGFFEMIEEGLSEKYNVTSINCFYMSTYNDNEYISRLITDDISLADIKTRQNQMLKKCKYSGIYPYLELPKEFLEHYKINAGDKQIIVKDCIKNNNTIFIYSAFVNDLLRSKNLSLFKLLRPGKIRKVLGEINIDNVISELEKNIKNLITINPKIKICIIGLFLPTRIFYIRNNLKEFIGRVNDSFGRLSKKYDNVVLVNNNNLSAEDFNNIDFHPNKRGHEKIYQNIVFAIRSNGYEI